MSNFPSESDSKTTKARKRPIPLPTHPRQYRAIGLIQGQYLPSPEKITRGSIITSEGVKIEAVLLGRLMSLLKNHLDLNRNYLWVVYPRSKQDNDTLHLQLVGVWEPENFDQENLEALKIETQNDPTCQNGYFSIRGEVVFYSEETQTVVVKIKQAPKKESETTKFFKLKLKGVLPPRPLYHFYDLQVQLEKEELVIKDSKDIGLASFQKPRKFNPKNKFNSDKPQKPRTNSQNYPNKPQSPTKIIKPIKKNEL